MNTMVTSVAVAISLMGGATGAAHHWQEPVAAAVSPTVASAQVRLQDPPPPPMGEHACARINDDGVRIHATFDMASAVLGLAYKGDLFKIRDFPGGGWWEGTDMRTGVHGWVRDQFVDHYTVYC